MQTCPPQSLPHLMPGHLGTSNASTPGHHPHKIFSAHARRASALTPPSPRPPLALTPPAPCPHPQPFPCPSPPFLLSCPASTSAHPLRSAPQPMPTRKESTLLLTYSMPSTASVRSPLTSNRYVSRRSLSAAVTALLSWLGGSRCVGGSRRRRSSSFSGISSTSSRCLTGCSDGYRGGSRARHLTCCREQYRPVSRWVPW